MKRLALIALLLGALLAGLSLRGDNQLYAGESCHQNGYCQDAGCDDNPPYACTYMDCGNGTELCLSSVDPRRE